MKVFADSSAVVKLYVPEAGSELLSGLGPMVVSALCRVEVSSAIARKIRLGDIGEIEAELMTREFELDLLGPMPQDSRFVAVPVNSEIVGSATRLVRRHDLRTLDAIQLATAIAAREVDPGLQVFACFDQKLAAAGATYGFSPIPSS